MATDNANTSGFGEVSRVRGIAFEYLSLGASVIGLVALGVLLVYVTIDAFDLANASPEWLLTYFLALVVPFLAFCLYSVNDPAVTRRSVGALGGGLVGVAAIFTAIEAFVVAIPRLSWQLAYLFVVAMPVTAYLAYVGSRGQVGAVGFGLVGRLVGGVAIGLALPWGRCSWCSTRWCGSSRTRWASFRPRRCTRTAAGARCRERRLRRSLSDSSGSSPRCSFGALSPRTRRISSSTSGRWRSPSRSPAGALSPTAEAKLRRSRPAACRSRSRSPAGSSPAASASPAPPCCSSSSRSACRRRSTFTG